MYEALSYETGCLAGLLEKLFGRAELNSDTLKSERELVLCVGKVGFGQV